ncbi:MAG: hypothetical protein AAFR27_13820, partial [Pseudomonadota bacterium]
IPTTETEIVLLFGYDRETYQKVERAPTNAFQTIGDQDLSVWCHALEATGFTLVPQNVAVPEAVLMIGYGMPAQYRRQETLCATAGSSATNLLLTCQVTPGTSGAPVLARSGDEPQFFGVVSASGPSGTLVERLPVETVQSVCTP